MEHLTTVIRRSPRQIQAGDRVQLFPQCKSSVLPSHATSASQFPVDVKWIWGTVDRTFDDGEYQIKLDHNPNVVVIVGASEIYRAFARPLRTNALGVLQHFLGDLVVRPINRVFPSRRRIDDDVNFHVTFEGCTWPYGLHHADRFAGEPIHFKSENVRFSQHLSLDEIIPPMAQQSDPATAAFVFEDVPSDYKSTATMNVVRALSYCDHGGEEDAHFIMGTVHRNEHGILFYTDWTPIRWRRIAALIGMIIDNVESPNPELNACVDKFKRDFTNVRLDYPFLSRLWLERFAPITSIASPTDLRHRIESHTSTDANDILFDMAHLRKYIDALFNVDEETNLADITYLVSRMQADEEFQHAQEVMDYAYERVHPLMVQFYRHFDAMVKTVLLGYEVPCPTSHEVCEQYFDSFVNTRQYREMLQRNETNQQITEAMRLADNVQSLLHFKIMLNEKGADPSPQRQKSHTNRHQRVPRRRQQPGHHAAKMSLSEIKPAPKSSTPNTYSFVEFPALRR